MITLILAGTLLALPVSEQKSSFYDKDGHYVGSSITYNGTTSFYDQYGHFLGTKKEEKK